MSHVVVIVVVVCHDQVRIVVDVVVGNDQIRIVVDVVVGNDQIRIVVDVVVGNDHVRIVVVVRLMSWFVTVYVSLLDIAELTNRSQRIPQFILNPILLIYATTK